MNDLKLVKEIERAYRQEGTAVLVTVIEADQADLVGSKLLIEFLETEPESVASDALQSWCVSHPHILAKIKEAAKVLYLDKRVPIETLQIEDGPVSLRVMMELVRAEPQLIICGAGHIGQAIAPIARLLDFAVVIIDDRADYACRDLFPDENIRLIVKPFAEALASVKIAPSTSVVIVTRGHKHDEACLRRLLPAKARYIGMIGSRRRVITVFRRLLDEGIPAEAFERVHAPIGLDIGARTPAEIAVSILAEVILTTYQGTGAPKRLGIKQVLEQIMRD